MRAIVIYESMFGNTRRIAAAVGAGLANRCTVVVLPVGEVTPADVGGVDLIVLGAPTHAWGLSRPSTRTAAVAQAAKPDSGLVMERGATGTGLREWLEGCGRLAAPVAVFDTRADAPRLMTGSAGARIAQQLRRVGCRIAGRPQSFRVTKASVLIPGQEEAARRWGEQLAAATTLAPA